MSGSVGQDETTDLPLLELFEVLELEKVQSDPPLHNPLDIPDRVSLPPAVHCLEELHLLVEHGLSGKQSLDTMLPLCGADIQLQVWLKFPLLFFGSHHHVGELLSK